MCVCVWWTRCLCLHYKKFHQSDFCPFFLVVSTSFDFTLIVSSQLYELPIHKALSFGLVQFVFGRFWNFKRLFVFQTHISSWTFYVEVLKWSLKNSFQKNERTRSQSKNSFLWWVVSTIALDFQQCLNKTWHFFLSFVFPLCAATFLIISLRFPLVVPEFSSLYPDHQSHVFFLKNSFCVFLSSLPNSTLVLDHSFICFDEILSLTFIDKTLCLWHC